MTDYAIAERTDMSQTIIERPASIGEMRARVAELREQRPAEPRIVGLLRRPNSPIWELAEP